MAKRLSKQEAQWLAELQAILNRCPSKRLGFYTTGDPWVTVIDQPAQDLWEENNGHPEQDYCIMVNAAGTKLGELRFPANVHSTAG